MNEQLLEFVQNTRNDMRKQQLYRVFKDFDTECMQLTAENRKEKYEKMLESPFRFFRGSAYLYYSDMMKIPSIYHSSPDHPIWIMGDMHMDNFGAFQNEQGELVYDVNDFDEGYIGSYLFDLMRMTVSIALYMQEQNISTKQQEKAIRSFVSGYIEQLRRFKEKKDDAATLIFTKNNTTGPIKKILKKLEKRQQTNLLDELSIIHDNGERVFKLTDEIQAVEREECQAIIEALPMFHIKDIVYKYGSGTASIGLKRYYLLVSVEGQTNDIILELKEVRIAIPAYFLPFNEVFWSHYMHQGARVVGTQRAMHHLEDPYLNYVTIDGVEFYIRERSPYKKKVKPTHYKSIEHYYETTATMGKIAAKIHARADKEYDTAFSYTSEKEILKSIGKQPMIFENTMVNNAMAYKEIVYADYEIFKIWVEKMA